MSKDIRLGPELQFEIEQFLYEEADLLTRGCFSEWLNRFSEDIHYWMPARMTLIGEEGAIASPDELAIFDDDKAFLEARVKRLASPLAHAERPASRVRYFITNVRIQLLDNDELPVQCNLLVSQTRLERIEAHFVAERVDRLRRHGESWLVSKRKIVLDQTMIPRSISIFF